MPETVERALRALVIALGAFILLDAVALAVVHASTLYAVNQTSGAWLSFAYYAREGVLYPPLAEHGYYAGTRYFPGFFLLHAGLAKLSGEFLLSGKLLSYLSAAGLIFGLTRAIDHKLKHTALSAALAMTVLATFIGHKASMTIRGDIFPAAISVAVLVLLERRLDKNTLSTRALLLIAALAALPPLAKFTSFHALTAGAIYLFFRDKKRGVLFGAVGFAVFIAGVVATHVLSDGRFFESLAAAATAPDTHKRTAWEAIRTYLEFIKYDRPFLLLFPFAFVALALTNQRFSLWRIYFVLQLVISIGFFFDTGAEYNHLIDLLAATIVLAAELAANSRKVLRIASLAAFSLAAFFGLYTYHRGAWTAPERGMDVQRYFAETLDLHDYPILAHDPSVAVLSGRRPVVADDFQYRVMVWRKLIAPTELPARIAQREFQRIVLLNPEAPPADDPEFNDVEMGTLVARAIRDHYVLERHVDRFYVYRPR